jgi:8-hydroxy-5-deazaflavin:NADPH oxidoreductase
MTYAIIGSGNIGGAVARQFARKGIDVLIANRRGPTSLADLIKELGANVSAVPLKEALQADVIVLAVHFGDVAEVVKQITPKPGRIVVDATNAIEVPAYTPIDLGGRPSSAVVEEQLAGVRLVKAFNTLPAAVLAADPVQDGGRRVVFLAGNDVEANSEIAGLIERLGFSPITLGKLAEGGLLQQFGGPLVIQNLIKQG